MENEENENIDSQNDTEATENATEESVESTETEGTEVNLEAEVKKATAPLYARMKQAEQEAKELKIKLSKTSVETPKKVSSELSTKDIYALMEAKVPEQDIDKVQEIAKLKGISVSEAIKLPLTKQILSDEAEQRQTASASNVGSSRRSSTKISDEVLLEKAQKGEMPENETDFERLFNARKGIK